MKKGPKARFVDDTNPTPINSSEESANVTVGGQSPVNECPDPQSDHNRAYNVVGIAQLCSISEIG
jgi:hypothetical protein